MSDDMRNATQGALALYLNEVQPVDGRVQINVSIDELTVLRHLAAAAPAVGGEVVAWRVEWIDGMLSFSVSEPWNDPSTIKSITPLYAAQPASQSAVGGEVLDDDPPMKWLIDRLRDLALELVADPKTPWIGERDPQKHICWAAADRLSAKCAADADAPIIEFGVGWAKVHFRREVTDQDRAILIAAFTSTPGESAQAARGTLEQIAVVCTDNMDRDCDHRIALDFVRQIANAALAARPASPLRGRDDLIPAGKQAKFKHAEGDWFGVFDWHDNPESFEYRTVYALSASPPEQPAAYPAQCAPWQPIETAPQDRTWVLVWEAEINDKYHPAEVARFVNNRWENSAMKYVNAVYWMPIPALTSTDRCSQASEIERCQDCGQELPIRYPCHEQGCTIKCRF